MSLWKIRPKRNATQFVVQINTYITFTVERKSTKNWATSVIFKKTAQNKPSPKSGHPAPCPHVAYTSCQLFSPTHDFGVNLFFFWVAATARAIWRR
jgi:hypothetical protein